MVFIGFQGYRYAILKSEITREKDAYAMFETFQGKCTLSKTLQGNHAFHQKHLKKKKQEPIQYSTVACMLSTISWVYVQSCISAINHR